MKGKLSKHQDFILSEIKKGAVIFHHDNYTDHEFVLEHQGGDTVCIVRVDTFKKLMELGKIKFNYSPANNVEIWN